MAWPLGLGLVFNLNSYIRFRFGVQLIPYEYAAEQSGANIPYSCTPHTNSVWQ